MIDKKWATDMGFYDTTGVGDKPPISRQQLRSRCREIAFVFA
ncbi:MAG: hypothetical protein P1U36_00725 [Legionellaceae bacterium]|nr:hypothetical protein [Legionellaceae bacterium]